MADLENYILSAVFFVVLCLLFFLWQWRRKKKKGAPDKFILDTLELARSQFEVFNIKATASQGEKNGLSGMLQAIDNQGLHFEIGDFVADDWQASGVEVYFRARRVEGPVFYVFHSKVQRVDSDYGNSHLLIAMPAHLRVEKKRHFIRVQPPRDDIRVIGVWQITPGKHLPKSTGDLGEPLTHYKLGMANQRVAVENISGAGLALRFALDKDGKPPFDFQVGSQLLCLVVFALSPADPRPTAFWCTGEIMNSRLVEGQKPAVVLGLEFTNWAVLAQGSDEIHWVHSSPSRGARPMLQWVEKVDKEATGQ